MVGKGNIRLAGNQSRGYAWSIRVGPSTVTDGRGVFATEAFSEGDLIERCHIIALNAADRKVIDDTGLYDYYFGWGQDGAALALGNGSLYNHSYEPNARYIKNVFDSTITIFAICPIERGEEILVNYNGDPENKSLVWFDQ